MRAQKQFVYDVLVEECGADEANREEFLRAWPECVEWRFMGLLGFGGKVWNDRLTGAVYVTCYPEDETPERLARIAAADADLERVLFTAQLHSFGEVTTNDD